MPSLHSIGADLHLADLTVDDIEFEELPDQRVTHAREGDWLLVMGHGVCCVLEELPIGGVALGEFAEEPRYRLLFGDGSRTVIALSRTIVRRSAPPRFAQTLTSTSGAEI